MGLAYTGDLFSNVTGGQDTGARYLDNIDVTLQVDLDELAGLANTTAYVYGLGNQGGSISALAGDVQGVDNIEAENSWRLYEAWVQHIFPEAKTSLLAGKYDVNSEFDVIPTAQLFINSSQGIGAAYGLSGVLGPSIFPYTSLGARLKVNPVNGVILKAAVLDGVPSNPGHTRGTNIFFHKNDGALLTAELSYTPGSHQPDATHKHNFLGRGVGSINRYRFTLGAWFYTESRVGWLQSDQRDKGLYASADVKLYNEPEHSYQGLAGYVRLGLANGKINQFSGYTGAGLVYTGLIDHRSDDQLGLAVAIPWNSADYQTFAEQQGLRPANDETDIEATYLFAFSSSFQFQFDLQYIIHPNTLHSISNSFLTGGRLLLSL